MAETTLQVVMMYLSTSAISHGVFFVVNAISTELRAAIRCILVINFCRLGRTISRYVFPFEVFAVRPEVMMMT